MPEKKKLALRLEGVSIDFRVRMQHSRSLREIISGKGESKSSVVKAVKNVSFDVNEGESVGIIGLNGSGKSTLLSGIAGVLPISEGRILVSDEPRLMGVSAVLMSESSGLKNIELGCLALGMSQDEVGERIGEIVSFTELGEAIHRPLKTYSSGMRARVQFAIATATSPKILLIDEALGVGDKDFRSKSRDRILKIVEEAGTLMMVNHSLDELARFCERGLLLRDGELISDGPMDQVINEYTGS